jgi:hypothetical protein
MNTNIIIFIIIIIITIISGISYLIFSYKSPSSPVQTTPTIAPKIYNQNNNIYEEFKGRCWTASGSTPDNYQETDISLSDCKTNCNNNQRCQAYSYVPANSIENNLSLCTIYSNSNTDSLNLPNFGYNKGQDQKPITRGDNELYYTCYNRL